MASCRRQTTTAKRSKAVVVECNQVEEAIQELENAKEILRKATKKVTKAVAKQSVKTFTTQLEASKEARKRVDYVFSRIKAEKCYIGRRNSEDYCFRITFEDEDGTACYGGEDFHTFINYTCDMHPNDDYRPLVVDYARMLLKNFLIRFYEDLSEYISDLIPLEEVLADLEKIK